LTEAPLRVVTIGGGTGLSALLRGLKRYSYLRDKVDGRARIDITAIVTVTDDGGSSGRLRRELDVLPPGDIRNCMVALAEDDTLMAELFDYRFSAGRGLKGHSFGNLFLTSLTQVTGDFLKAIQVSSEVLAIHGHIYPSTRANVVLEAITNDGERLLGETRIGKSRRPLERILLKPRRCKPLPQALEAIRNADLITLGPGSLYTSVIPNLLVEGVPKAIRQSRATKAYFANLMWQPWETMQYSAADHVEAILRHAGRGPARQLIDTVIVNTRHIGGERRRRYAAQKVYPVETDLPRLNRLGLDVLGHNLLARGEKVRHDPATIAEIAVMLAAQARARTAARR
jgi:uncharacterized cofD-like protein